MVVARKMVALGDGKGGGEGGVGSAGSCVTRSSQRSRETKRSRQREIERDRQTNGQTNIETERQRRGNAETRPSSRASSGIGAVACLVNPRHRMEDRFLIALSRKLLLETHPMPAAHSAISFRTSTASGPAAGLTICLITLRYETAGAGACAAVLVPLELIFGLSRCPCRPCCSRNSGSCERVCHAHVHHDQAVGQEWEQVKPLGVAWAACYIGRGGDGGGCGCCCVSGC